MSPTSAAHGTRTRYQSGCRCAACRADNARYTALNRAAYANAHQRPREAPTTP